MRFLLKEISQTSFDFSLIQAGMGVNDFISRFTIDKDVLLSFRTEQ